MNKKGNLSFYFVFIVLMIIMVVITAIVAPLGTRIGVEFYAAGDDIFNGSKDKLSAITDDDVRKEINNTITQAQDNQQLNINTNANLFKYGWLFIGGITLVGLFLLSRRLSEIRGGGFVG